MVIFDLGLSSIQLDDFERGFSFNSEKKLDMTMGLNEVTALDTINNLREEDLKLIIKILGDEKEATRIAKNIVKYRNIKKITNTSDLAKIIEKSKRKKATQDGKTKTTDDGGAVHDAAQAGATLWALSGGAGFRLQNNTIEYFF